MYAEVEGWLFKILPERPSARSLAWVGHWTECPLSSEDILELTGARMLSEGEAQGLMLSGAR